MILESFFNKLDGATKEAVNESWELGVWLLQKLLGSTHRNDIDRIVLMLSSWAASDDMFCKINADIVTTLVTNLTNIVSALKNSLNKRKKTPVVTPEVLQKIQETSTSNSNGSKHDALPSKTSAIKKSVSTGFLSALNNDNSEASSTELNGNNNINNASTNTNKHVKKFTKLQPFRKNVVLLDNLRDKIREECRNFLNNLRSALKVKGGVVVSVDSQDMIDRIIFMLSHESGFFWNDVYSSLQIDEIAQDDRSQNAINKLDGLLKLRVTQVELRSTEAKRRLNFFINSLFMDIPSIPSARYCKDYTCITPYYSEDILLTKEDLQMKNSDGVSTLLYLMTLYKDDWNNFLERQGIKEDEQLIWSQKHLVELRVWCSLRAQTLFRTVEGMMYTEASVRLLAELEQYSESDVDLITKLKFQYVVACQVYGSMKKNLDHKADDIEFFLARYPNIRVAYIDAFRTNREGDMAYYSVLIKYEKQSSSGNSTSSLKEVSSVAKETNVKEVYRIKLPGNPVLGEGKPENQNHAIVFTRGRFLQAIDMNQDGYFEESLKMRNVLQEFDSGCSILGLREHIFTGFFSFFFFKIYYQNENVSIAGSVSSVANYMALQELSFVTLGQRVLNQPLRIRQHYGHPDLFDKIFVMTEGGMSKASRGINLSEDVFAGFNATIRGHSVNFKEYVVVGKGRDVGLQQTYKFEAKLSQGNAEQSLSRDLSRICDRLDFFRLLSFYYGGIGHYLANTMVMFTLVVVVYTMLALAIYNEEGVNGRAIHPEGVLQLLLCGEFI
jgi:callose synthase